MSFEYTIGYIDEDISQVKLYQRKLRDYGFKVIGYQFTKGMSLVDLMNQVYASAIDLLMIDFKLNQTNIVSFNGNEVEEEIYETKPLFPHIIFTNKVDQAEPHVIDWKIIFDKDKVFQDKDTTDKFAKMLEKSIVQYKNYVRKRKLKLEELMFESFSRTLTSLERDLVYEIQQELRFLDKHDKKEIPSQLNNREAIDDLSSRRRSAEELLNKYLKEK